MFSSTAELTLWVCRHSFSSLIHNPISKNLSLCVLPNHAALQPPLSMIWHYKSDKNDQHLTTPPTPPSPPDTQSFTIFHQSHVESPHCWKLKVWVVISDETDNEEKSPLLLVCVPLTLDLQCQWCSHAPRKLLCLMKKKKGLHHIKYSEFIKVNA